MNPPLQQPLKFGVRFDNRYTLSHRGQVTLSGATVFISNFVGLAANAA